jgi:anti-sigma B factor antagonist
MEISSTIHRRVVVVTVSGRIDTSTSTEFEEALEDLIEKGQKNLVMDFGAVDFLSSSGLRVLVTIRKKLHQAGGNIVLATPSERAADSFEIAGLDKLFPSYPDRESAVGAF